MPDPRITVSAPPIRVTAHFARSEFDQRQWSGGPRKIYPTKWVVERLIPLCEALETLRADLGGPRIHILSGYRSEEYNKAISGAPRSQHVEGRAADIRVEGVPAGEVHEAMLRLCMGGRVPQVRGLGAYPSFTHVDIRPTVRLVRWGGDWTPSQ